MIHLDPVDSDRLLMINNGDKENFCIGSIGSNSYINSMDLNLHLGDEVVNLQIGRFCSIAYNVIVLVNRNHDYKSVSTSTVELVNSRNKKIKEKGQIIIGNDVWIGNNTILLSGIKIGNGAVIGAGTVVSKDIPPYSIAAGNPVKIIKYRFEEEQINKLQGIKWWNWNLEKISENKDWFSADISDFTNHFYNKPKEIKRINMSVKNNSILFIPDFDDPYPIWSRVLSEYISRFNTSDDITLILRIPNSGEFDLKVSQIMDLLHGRDEIPDILIVNDELKDEWCLFKNLDYFITNRGINTIRYIEMAEELGVKILSGVDKPVFDIN